MRVQSAITTSWDDGHPLDLRIAELLHKHRLQGTFYVPSRVAPGGCCNPEGFAVMKGAELRQISSSFELGSHTLDHRSLNALGTDEARHQIVAGKEWLESEVGQEVEGFCYPNGHHNETVRSIVAGAGFRYARTTEDHHDQPGDDVMAIPVSMQFYPRSRRDVARGFLREERRRLAEWRWPRRLGMFSKAVASDDFVKRTRGLIDRVCANGGVFHVWGHSWEIERFNGWSMLDDLLRYAAERFPAHARLTNGEVVRSLGIRAVGPDPSPAI
jgi:peptidoglycan/xylan/chitin deacetylase (PgdA/CDA1 family)